MRSNRREHGPFHAALLRYALVMFVAMLLSVSVVAWVLTLAANLIGD